MINIVSVLSSNIVGFLLMTVLLFSRGWRIQTKNSESHIILVMILADICGCFVDPIAFYSDGKPGKLYYFLVLFSNTILFALNVILGPAYITLIVRHIHEKLSQKQLLIIKALCSCEVIILIINIFKPIVFYVDETSTYHRLSLYWFFILVELFFLLYGLYVYLVAKRKGHFLRFFPAWQFLVPIFTGMTIQSIFYGTSLIWPCVGVAICCITVSLQNESIYCDKLTGAFNRYYLSEVYDSIRRSGGKFGALMLDMNGFKQINDDFSHAEGDNALIAIAEIINNVVGNKGVIIRFAGDEFIIILDSPSSQFVDLIKDQITHAISDYNQSSVMPFELSASIGGTTFDLKTDTEDTFIRKIDQLMYEDKSKYYAEHNRRRS
ncbi:GGDEF domain-containing protein [Butyrivibrio sp. AE3004]|uniref:GGDEF domain-containing protein n=1 Tax=Butyrivibrio sp. AE3004 TaxID=1506994 RepID=UPI00068F927B|nr:GGDEF domain-containing protein [Butyrivibrio sp. AE3004]